MSKPSVEDLFRVRFSETILAPRRSFFVLNFSPIALCCVGVSLLREKANYWLPSREVLSRDKENYFSIISASLILEKAIIDYLKMKKKDEEEITNCLKIWNKNFLESYPTNQVPGYSQSEKYLMQPARTLHSCHPMFTIFRKIYISESIEYLNEISSFLYRNINKLTFSAGRLAGFNIPHISSCWKHIGKGC